MAERSFEAATAVKATNHSHFGLGKDPEDRFRGPREMAGGLPRYRKLD
jgi:hypothetical protein